MHIFIGQNGVQSGPIPPETLAARIADGTVRMTDLAWTSGETAWITVAEFARKHGIALAPPPPETPPAPTEAARAGRFSENTDLLKLADARLAGAWWPTFGTLWVEGALGAAVTNLPFIGMFGQLLITPILQLGATTYLMHRARPHASPAEIGLIFKPFNDFGRALAIVYLQALWLMIWGLPFFALLGIGVALGVADLPVVVKAAGIILTGTTALAMAITLTVVSLRYALTTYLALDQPLIPVGDCMRASIRMMAGHKLRLWLLGLRALLAPALAVCGLAAIGATLLVLNLPADHAGTQPKPEVILRLLGLLCPLVLFAIPVFIWLIRCSIRYRVAVVIFQDERRHVDAGGRA